MLVTHCQFEDQHEYFKRWLLKSCFHFPFVRVAHTNTLTHSHDGMQESVDCRLLPLRAFGFNLLNPWCKTELIYTLKWRKKRTNRNPHHFRRKYSVWLVSDVVFSPTSYRLKNWRKTEMKVNEQSKKQHFEDVFAVSDQNATKKLSLFSS